MKKHSGRFLAMLLALALCVGLLPITAAATDDIAEVTLRYSYTDYDGEHYNTVYASRDPVRFQTLQEAFAAAENTDYLSELPEKVQQIAAENPYWFNYYPGTIKLLQDATVSTEITVNESDTVDLNGYTLTVDENGSLTGSGWITFESETPGTFVSCGTVAIDGLGCWSGDDIEITGGTLSGYFGVDGGTVNISGGSLTGGFMFNNGGTAPIDATISGDACLAQVTAGGFVIYEPVVSPDWEWHNIHLTLDGGYYDADPRILYKTLIFDNEYNVIGIGERDRYETVSSVVDGFRYYTRSGDSEENYVYTEIAAADVLESQLANSEIYLCYRDFVTADDSKVEQYSGQTDWAADPAVYPWRIGTGSGGTVTPTHVPGDLNGDNTVNMRDLLTLRQALAGGYGVVIPEGVGDINHDGFTNMRDLLTLRQYLAGGYGVTL